MPVKARLLKLLVTFEYCKVFNGIRSPCPNVTFAPALRSTPQVLNKSGQRPCRLLYGIACTREHHMGHWFRCRNQLPPLIRLTRTTIEAIPAITTGPDDFTLWTNKAMAQRPGIRTKVERFCPNRLCQVS